MNWRAFSVLAMLAACWGTAHAVDLVTPQEMQASMAAPEPLLAKTGYAPGAPLIEVLAPRLGAPISSPSNIELLFQSTATSVVRPETFKVLYGRLRIDITQRLVNAAKVTPQGITVKEASLPKGSHLLQLSVEDTEGRRGQKTIEFEVN